MYSFSYNASALTDRTETWAKAAGLSLAQALKKQAGLLKEDLWRGAPPANRARASKRAERDVFRHFRPIPRNVFTDDRKDGRLRWLYSGKSGSRFLLGVRHQDFRPGLSLPGVIRARRALRGKTFGNAYQPLGRRGKVNPFNVLLLNRIVLSRSTIAATVRDVRDRFGRQKAAWAVDIEKFGGRRPPQWIAKHLGRAKGQTIASLAGDKPTIFIRSTATGVESRSSLGAVRRAIKKRMGAMLADMRLYLNGTKKAAGLKGK